MRILAQKNRAICLAVSSNKPRYLEKLKIERGCSAGEQTGRDFAERGCEFEPMAGAGTRDKHLWKVRVEVQNKMFIGRVGVHANSRRSQRTGSTGQEAFKQAARVDDFICLNGPVETIRVCSETLVMNTDLDAVSQIGEPIKESAGLIFTDINRADRGQKD